MAELNDIALKQNITDNVYENTAQEVTGDILQNVLVNIADSKASKISPVFTGAPEVPTAEVGTDTDQAASTAYVLNALTNAGINPNPVQHQILTTSASITPALADGLIRVTALETNTTINMVVGTIPENDRKEFQFKPKDANKTITWNAQYNLQSYETELGTTVQDQYLIVIFTYVSAVSKYEIVSVNTSSTVESADFLDSPEFTGVPTTPTPTEGDNTTQIANTEWVNSALKGKRVQNVDLTDIVATATITPDDDIEVLYIFNIAIGFNIVNQLNPREGSSFQIIIQPDGTHGFTYTFDSASYVSVGASVLGTDATIVRNLVYNNKLSTAKWIDSASISSGVAGEVVQTIVVPEPPSLNPTTQISTINKTTTIVAINPLLNNLSLGVASGTKSKKLLIQIMGGTVKKTVSLNGFTYVGRKNNLVDSNVFTTVPNKLLSIECSIVIDADDNESKSILDFSIEGVDDNAPKVQKVLTSENTVVIENDADVIQIHANESATFTIPNVSDAIDGHVQRVEISSANNNGTVLNFGNRFVFNGSPLRRIENGTYYAFDYTYNANLEIFQVANLTTEILVAPTVYFHKTRGSAQGELNNPNKPFDDVALAHSALTTTVLSRANKGRFVIIGELNEVITVIDNVCYAGNYTIGDGGGFKDLISTNKNVQFKGNIAVNAPTTTPNPPFLPSIPLVFQFTSDIDVVIDILYVEADNLLLCSNGAKVDLTVHGNIHTRSLDYGYGISPRGNSSVTVDCKGDIYSDFGASVLLEDYSGRFKLKARDIYNTIGNTNANFAYYTVLGFNNLLSGAEIEIQADNFRYTGSNFVANKTAVIGITNTTSTAKITVKGSISAGLGAIVNMFGTGAVNLTLNMNGGLATSNGYGLNIPQTGDLTGVVVTIKNGQFDYVDSYIGRRRKVIFENVKLKNTSIAGSNKPMFVCQDNTVGNNTTIILRDTFLKTLDGNNSSIISGTPVGVNWYSEGKVRGTCKVGNILDSSVPTEYAQTQTLDF